MLSFDHRRVPRQRQAQLAEVATFEHGFFQANDEPALPLEVSKNLTFSYQI